MSGVDGRRAACDAAEGHCHVCADEAAVARVLEVSRETGTAIVAMAGERVTVALDLVDADVGDQLLVHLGFAIQRLEREGEREHA